MKSENKTFNKPRKAFGFKGSFQSENMKSHPTTATMTTWPTMSSNCTLTPPDAKK